MVVKITVAVRWFVLILLVVLAGFSLSFFVLYRAGTGIINLPDVVDSTGYHQTVEDNVYGYDTWYSSFLPGFALMLGAFDLQEFESSGDKDVMAFLFTIFQFFVNIVMLNLLIAIMGDKYAVVQESGDQQYLYAKAQIILEYETRLTREYEWLCCNKHSYGVRGKNAFRSNKTNFPTWLQLLEVKKDDLVSEEMS